MRSMFPNCAPVSAFAAAGACAVPTAARLRGGSSPAVSNLLMAPELPMTHQDQAQQLIMAVAGYSPVQETIPSTKLGGFRGIPPRGRPV